MLDPDPPAVWTRGSFLANSNISSFFVNDFLKLHKAILKNYLIFVLIKIQVSISYENLTSVEQYLY